MTFAVGDALDLLDWKRQVFQLYERVRADPDPRSSWELWVSTRDRLFREHPQSPVPTARRADFAGCRYFDYDPGARVLGDVAPLDSTPEDVVSSAGAAAFPFSRVGTVRFELDDGEHALPLLWNEGYGGGLFLCFQDGTSGHESYGAGRYLLDTVKGSDLGTKDGRLVLDFNFAYNPSCAYDGSWACPLAPRESRLSRAVRAGEQTPPG
jgi:uncharacterized protein (DUF1684 family)